MASGPQDLDEARALLVSLARALGCSEDALPRFGEPITRDEEWTLRHQAGCFRLDYFERGLERQLASSKDFEDVAFEVLRSLSQAAAIAQVKGESPGTGDSRRLWFARQCSLMQALGEPWGARMTAHQEATLAAHPFDDHAEARIDRMRTHEREGVSREEAYRRALEQFPAPIARVPTNGGA